MNFLFTLGYFILFVKAAPTRQALPSPIYQENPTTSASSYPAPLPLPASSYNDNRKLTLLHTNDIHAHMEEFNYGGTACNPSQIVNNQCFGGVARIKTVVDAFRANTSNLILLDAGDQFQGTLFFNYYGGNVSSLVMNLLEYDAMTIGNHEFDNGVDELSSFIKSLHFPVISSNIDTSTEHLTTPLRDAGVKPYIVLSKFNLGIIGYITNTTASIIANGEKLKSSILDPVETVQKYVDELHSRGIHRIICLSHNGYKDDVYLAQNVQGVQLIVGGHSHSYLSKNASDPRTEGPYPTRTLSALDGKPVYVVQAHRYGDYLGHLDLEWDEKDQLISVAGDPISLDQTIAKDQVLNETISYFAEAFSKLASDVVTQSTTDFHAGCGGIECPMGDLLTDCIISEQNELQPPIDFAFINTGEIRASFSKGFVSAADILNVLPFGNTVVNFPMTGAQLATMLDRWAGDGDSQKLVSKPQVSGLEWKYDPNQESGKRVIFSQINGQPINPSQSYMVSTVDFVLNGGDNMILFKPDKMPSPGIVLADLFTSCLRKKSSITPSIDGRTTIVYRQ